MNTISKKTVKTGKSEVVEIGKSGRTLVRVGANGKAHIILRVDNHDLFNHDLIVELTGQGAVCLVSAMFHGHRADRHDFRVRMHHTAPDTKGDILIKGVYEDRSRGYISGLIKVAPDAQKTNSYFADHILLLDEAVAESLPTLEIEANDVKASHGSTTSKIDEEQLFYLGSRGVRPAVAKQMIINGFFHPIFTRLPHTTHKENESV